MLRESCWLAATLGNVVPRSVELGYHLCYGMAGGKHFKEPADTALLTEMANRISTSVGRPLQWMHLPVPPSRSDAAYFAPLSNLRLGSDTEVYLGLVHLADGVIEPDNGCKRRTSAAALRGGQRVWTGLA
jgi:hypothetical protein